MARVFARPCPKPKRTTLECKAVDEFVDGFFFYIYGILRLVVNGTHFLY